MIKCEITQCPRYDIGNEQNKCVYWIDITDCPLREYINSKNELLNKCYDFLEDTHREFDEPQYKQACELINEISVEVKE